MSPLSNAAPATPRRTGSRVARLGVLAVLLSAALALGGHQAAPAAALAGAPNGDVAGLVDIGGGRHLYLECRGQGSPTVVLEAGYRSPATVWSDDLLQPEMPRMMVLAGVAAVTRVCLYERPGAGTVLDDVLVPSRSDPVPQPRMVSDMVADLHALLQAASVPGPYVLVGHSLGGALVRLYAAAYPDEVVGMVLVDAGHEDLFAEEQALLTPGQWATVEQSYQTPLEGYPEYERVDIGTALAQLRRARADTPLHPMPLAVLSSNHTFGSPPDLPVAELERMWRRQQDDLVTLVPNARHTIAGQSGHFIQLDQPALVTEAIRQVVEGVRQPDTWYDLTSCCTQ
jgi:pimeloyl-ACP methyl ester carboxylesterase